jgi:uncharacterized membrane protein YbhN (UPF0104 family)
MGSQLALFICSVTMNGLLGLSVLLESIAFRGTAVHPILLLAFAAMASSVAILRAPLGRIRVPASLRLWQEKAVSGWAALAHDPRLLMKLLAFQFAATVLLAARYWLAFHMLSQNVDTSQVLLFSSASILTQTISFLPGGLGVREVIVGGIASLMGFGLATSVAAVALDRVVATAVTVVLGAISTLLLSRHVLRVSDPM